MTSTTLTTLEQNVRNVSGSKHTRLPVFDGSFIEVEFNAGRLSRTKLPHEHLSWNARTDNDVPLKVFLTRTMSGRKVHEVYEIEAAESVQKREQRAAVEFQARMLEHAKESLISVMKDITKDFQRKVEVFQSITNRLQNEGADDDDFRGAADEMLNDIKWFSANLRTDLVVKYATDIAVLTERTSRG